MNKIENEEKQFIHICNYINKLISEVDNSNIKQNTHKIIEIKGYITDLNDFVVNLNKNNSLIYDLSNAEKINRNNLISKINNKIKSYREEYDKLNNKLSNFNEELYYKNKTQKELYDLRDKKEKELNSKFKHHLKVTKQTNIGLREMKDVLDNDKIITENQHKSVKKYLNLINYIK